MKKDIIILGAGIAGLAAAAHLAKQGRKVLVLEKTSVHGGRVRQFEQDGFLFDMGPSWYWMPEIFEQFYQEFGHKTADFYQLEKLSPSYRVFWGNKEFDDVEADEKPLSNLFEKYEKSSSEKLKEFLKQAKYKYETGMLEFVEKPGDSIWEFFDFKIFKAAFKLDLIKNMTAHIRSFFTHPRLVKLLEFPVLFLGASPKETPAMYSMMNYADLVLGTWYPQGGMNHIVNAMYQICLEQGVEFHFNEAVNQIFAANQKVTKVQSNKAEYECETLVGAADYHHVEQMLPDIFRQYDEDYWQSRTMAPSCLIYYLGIDKKIESLQHHNLFFDRDLYEHAEEIYHSHQWPKEPLFYVCCPSKTDKKVAPEGKENLFILIPVSTNLKDTDNIREQYLDKVISRMEAELGTDIKAHISVMQSFANSNFISLYNSFKGNAYGLANTLRQTAVLKPKMKHKLLKNMFFCGQLTVPGPGMPPAIISGKVVAKQVLTYLNN